MADAYAVYDRVTTERGITRLCCWTHARRNFLPHEKDPFATEVIARIERQADTQARDQRLSPADAQAHRAVARREQAVPLLAGRTSRDARPTSRTLRTRRRPAQRD